MRRALPFASALFTLAVAFVGHAADEPKPLAGKELVAELQKGGYVLFMRHPATDQDAADTDTMNLDNLKAQRHLTDEGRNQAKSLGKSLRKLNISMGTILASKYYRAIEAAKLADLGEVATDISLTEAQNVSPNEAKRRGEGVKKLLATEPPKGKNTMLVSHRPNLTTAAGKDFGDLAEGEIAVFKPMGDKKFQCVARVKIDEWSKWSDGN